MLGPCLCSQHKQYWIQNWLPTSYNVPCLCRRFPFLQFDHFHSCPVSQVPEVKEDNFSGVVLEDAMLTIHLGVSTYFIRKNAVE